MRQSSLFCVCALLLAAVGCSSETTEITPAEPDPVHIELHADSQVHSTVVEPGDNYQFERADHGALVVLFDGHLEGEDDFSVEVERVFDAEVYVGPEDKQGDPHWVTRASVLNEDDESLWTQRINSHYQLLQFIQPVLEEFAPAGLDLEVEPLYQLVRNDYPELLQFPVKVPNELPGAHSFVLEIEDDPGEWRRVAEFPIEELEDQKEQPDPDFDYDIESLVDHGDPDDRINVAILGDGYTEDEREVFEKDAEAVADRLIETSPMAEHADLFNIDRVFTPSAESGAGYDCNYAGAPAECEQDFRDTPFGTTFIIPAMADRYGFDVSELSDRVAMPMDIVRIYELASLMHYDEVMLIANSNKFSGFAGMYTALVTNYDDRDRFPDTAVHEVGHTMGKLGDEYYNSADACYYNEPDLPLPVNIDKVDDGEEVKWSEWLDEPLPEGLDDEQQVGAYDPAFNCEFLVRPVEDCKMNSSTEEFCPICAEQMVRRFYSLVPPAGGEPSVATFRDNGALDLQVPLRDDANIDRYEVSWSIDGEPRDVTGTSIRLDARELDDDPTEVVATVRNRSEFLQTHDHTTATEYRFLVKAAPSED